MLSVSVEGDGVLAARFAAMPSAVQAALRVKADRLAEALVAHVKQDKLSGQVLQVRSGALRASIGAEVTDNGETVTARVFSSGDVKYAAIQEYGGRTPAHDIVPVKAKALAFMIGGKQVFARIVHHPGSTIPARSYLGSALADMGPQIIAQMNAAVLDALAGRGTGGA